MRVARLAPITKPRTVSRRAQESVCADDMVMDQPKSFLAEYDLEQEDVFTIEALRPDETKAFVDLDAYPYIFENDADVLSWACAVLSDSPLARGLLTEARSSGWKLALSDLGTGGFHLDAHDKVIEIDDFNLDVPSLGRSSYFRISLLCVLAKALRDIWHENRWGAFEVNYNPEAVVQLERARAADTDSMAVLIGWELRGAGYSDIWRHIIGSDDGDMAEVLTNILERYPTALYNGMAMAHIFRQWYADIARVDALDHASLEHMDYALCDDPKAFGDKTVSALDLETLSTLPDGRIYLDDLGATVARDPFFCAINDPINQAHLFQITYDSKVTYVDGIPFRDKELARKFFS